MNWGIHCTCRHISNSVWLPSSPCASRVRWLECTDVPPPSIIVILHPLALDSPLLSSQTPSQTASSIANTSANETASNTDILLVINFNLRYDDVMDDIPAPLPYSNVVAVWNEGILQDPPADCDSAAATWTGKTTPQSVRSCPPSGIQNNTDRVKHATTAGLSNHKRPNCHLTGNPTCINKHTCSPTCPPEIQRAEPTVHTLTVKCGTGIYIL